MFSVELYGRVRHACQVEGLSQREAARRFGLHRKTVRKMLAFSVPPGYRRSKARARPKLDPFTPSLLAFWRRTAGCAWHDGGDWPWSEGGIGQAAGGRSWVSAVGA